MLCYNSCSRLHRPTPSSTFPFIEWYRYAWFCKRLALESKSCSRNADTMFQSMYNQYTIKRAALYPWCNQVYEGRVTYSHWNLGTCNIKLCGDHYYPVDYIRCINCRDGIYLTYENKETSNFINGSYSYDVQDLQLQMQPKKVSQLYELSQFVFESIVALVFFNLLFQKKL